MNVEHIKELEETYLTKIKNLKTLDDLDIIKVDALGKKGKFTEIMKTIASMTIDEKKSFGALVNTSKSIIVEALDLAKKQLEKEELEKKLNAEAMDLTLPCRFERTGKIHPVSQVIDEIIAIFGEMGLSLKDGADIETFWYNFNALNISEDHPACQEHDTFYMCKKDSDDRNFVLRTHTSPIQIRVMEKKELPIKIIAAGRTYRCDYDATHSPMFHQVEGLVIDKNITMANLKGTLVTFLREFFELDDLPVRFRPSYFPFTEPSMEVDVACSRKNGELKIGEGDDWLEILGCGMVHNQVLANVGIDSDEYQGFAFGMGVERLAMLKYGIPDLRSFYEGDERWLNYYGFDFLRAPNLVGGI